MDAPLLVEYTKRMIDWDYGFGDKAKDLDVQLSDKGKRIDCSGYVRLMFWKLCKILIPDGSWAQGKWFDKQGFKVSSPESAKLKDGILRVAVLPVTKDHPGHVLFVYNGRTYESKPGTGPSSRPWTGTRWQAKCKVWVVSRMNAVV